MIHHHPPRRPLFAGILWTCAVVGIGLGALCVAAAHQQPAKQTSPETTPPNQRPDRQLPHIPETKGEIRHGIAQAPPKAPGTIRIACYNLENLYDPAAPGAEPAKFDSGESTHPKPDEHRKALAAAIHAVNPDILAVQEIESRETLVRFRDQYLADMGYDHVASIDAGDPRGIEQSVLSRYPLSDAKVWIDTPLGGTHPEKLGNRPNPEAGQPLILKRSPLAVKVTIPPGEAGGAGGKASELCLFVVHHKSGAYHGYQREAESKGVLGLITEWEKAHSGGDDSHVIIVGDFNARINEQSVKTYLDAGYTDPFAGVLFGGDPPPPVPGTTAGARTPTVREDPKYISHVSGRTIDRFLLNRSAAQAFDVKTRFVLGTMQRPENVDWRTTSPPSGYASDHYPIVIDLAPRVN